jgi:hypothetical protein
MQHAQIKNKNVISLQINLHIRCFFLSKLDSFNGTWQIDSKISLEEQRVKVSRINCKEQDGKTYSPEPKLLIKLQQ